MARMLTDSGSGRHDNNEVAGLTAKKIVVTREPSTHRVDWGEYSTWI
jgi:hypothetical protein